jgi:hypothetical protein
MGLVDIKRAIKRVNEEGSQSDVRKILVIVPIKRGYYDRDDMLKTLARSRGETLAEVKKEYKGATPAIILRAESHDSRPFEGDLTFLYHGSFELISEIGYLRPNQVRWEDAEFVDDNLNLFPTSDWEEIAGAILYGTDGGGGPYFASKQRSRY